jgi:hypothetical protein
MTLRNIPHSRAFLMLDTLAGLVLLGALFGAMLYTGALRQRSAMRLSQQRRATEAARAVLTALQMNQPAAVDASVAVKVVRSGVRVGEMEWADVTAADGRGRAALSGLVPTTAPATQPGGAP